MPKFLNINPEIFGIDINDLSLRIVKLKKVGNNFKLVSFNEAQIKPGVIKEGAIQDEASLASIIKDACASVKGKKLGTKYAIISLPEEKSFSQVIQMPYMNHEELITAVPFEAENYIPLAIDKVYLDFQILEEHKGQNNSSHLDLMINVMPKNVVDAYVSCFKKAGLIPCILEVESQAIVRSLLRMEQKMPSMVFVDFGQTKTSFIIFSGNSIRFTCTIPVSSQQLTHAIVDGLGISFEKAEELKVKKGLETKKEDKSSDIASLISPILSDLAEQIKKYINFYQGHVSHEYFPSDGKIDKIILCGGGANLKELPDFLFKKLKIQVEVGNPLLNILPEKKNKKKSIPSEKILSYTTALGLALRGADTNLSNNHQYD
ncbi:MAG: hypothetical protein A3F47_01455 [Candidatus Staskawiczbacteria bacterium RIFCSPHIGHO2_12_FULL_38_11]|uniref:SHS2 domain-containing protein n=1 Tax=Candidatus Staskawiczbacteria bacterium RIFCSPHIGHO2_12_FULL_38_11 TaxID=1802209 RepID=A0A1G2I894_9BACT|nr:MAG: hypothetical protein A3F47_01455 [Candidatus Staskawiczbacteria bacterium RIFCSPHIGHO2_12_FULL_38_11]